MGSLLNFLIVKIKHIFYVVYYSHFQIFQTENGNKVFFVLSKHSCLLQNNIKYVIIIHITKTAPFGKFRKLSPKLIEHTRTRARTKTFWQPPPVTYTHQDPRNK